MAGIKPETKKAGKREKRAGQLNKVGATQLPQKKLYRQRAHANPFADHALE